MKLHFQYCYQYLFYLDVNFIYFFLRECASFEASCKSGLKSFHTGKCIKKNDQKLNWSEASRLCRSQGDNGDLVKIVSSDMNTEIYEKLFASQQQAFWHGQSFLSKMKGGYVNWQAGHPRQQGETCGLINAHGTDEWTDESCASKHFAICEEGRDVCPPGWIPSSPSSSCVRLHHTRMSWDDARFICQLEDADLVVIQNDDMNRFISDQLTSDQYETYWIGLHNDAVAGEYRWLELYQQINYSYWDPNRTGFDSNLNCAGVTFEATMTWDVYSCDSMAKFICEQPEICENQQMHGPNCTEPCDAACSGPHGACFKHTGWCVSCPDGYEGHYCEKACRPGTYGRSCLLDCSPHCAGTYKACGGANGSCLLGCEAGYRGDMCDTPCDNETYGANCMRYCSIGCAGPHDACDSRSGRCLFGCDPWYPYYGPKCMYDHQVGDLTARQERTLRASSVSAVVGILFVAIVLIYNQIAIHFAERKGRDENIQIKSSQQENSTNSISISETYIDLRTVDAISQFVLPINPQIANCDKLNQPSRVFSSRVDPPRVTHSKCCKV
ncbi:hypothetical protein EGW08_009511 [Elysia chlorotica]|uniref:C-type lectin domain-containing protein n=1 Tax=Elysia chlorotica TaxID=188477 RepID=A0A433TMH8_ELYCH|nr:hypothetical protein EGW08_009511 [Elysia chlorotica]